MLPVRMGRFAPRAISTSCRSLVLLLVALLCSDASRAQLDTVDVYLDAITAEDGLPMGYVLAMAQDSTGYLWFGTNDGLARYDGYDFTVFRHDPQDSNSIGSNRISSLLVDREGYLWVGFAPFGLDRYDPRTGRFAHVRVNGLDDEVASARLEGLCVDARDRVWMTALIPNNWSPYVVDPALPGALAVMDPRQLRPPITPVRDAFAHIGPGGDPWFTSPDTIRCAHYASDGSVQLTDRPHSILWRMDDGTRQAPVLMADPGSGTMLVIEPGFITRMNADKADPVDTIRLPVYDHRKCVLLDQHGRLEADRVADRTEEPDVRFDVATGRTEVV
ncbi:MAG TPA: two-component regulator propeller domain-containing protein, partial [Flavobacteriales bacterium]|nr:two-component regulator propeller domain-containing protein [Flavobacteriales bacterium]